MSSGEAPPSRGAWIGAEARNLASITAGLTVSGAISFLYTVVAGRKLGPAAYSDFTAALAIATMAGTALGPLPPLVAQMISERAARGEAAHAAITRAAILRVLRVGLPVLLIAALVCRPAARLLGFLSPLALWLGVAAFVTVLLTNVVRGGARGAGQHHAVTVSTIGESALRLGVGFVLLSSMPFAAVAVGLYPATALLGSLAVAWRLGVFRAGSYERIEFHGPSQTSALFLVFGVALLQQADLLFAKSMLPAHEAGLYGAAAMLSRTMAFLMMPFDAVMIPRVTRLLTGGTSARPFLIAMAIAITGVTVPVLALFGLFPSQIVTTVFGARYAAAASLLFILGVGMTGAYVVLLLGQYALVTGRQRLLWCLGAGVLLEAAGLVWAGARPMVIAWVPVIATSVASLLFLGSFAIAAKKQLIDEPRRQDQH